MKSQITNSKLFVSPWDGSVKLEFGTSLSAFGAVPAAAGRDPP